MSMNENCLCVLVVTKTAKVSVSGVGLGLGLPGLGFGLGHGLSGLGLVLVSDSLVLITSLVSICTRSGEIGDFRAIFDGNRRLSRLTCVCLSERPCSRG